MTSKVEPSTQDIGNMWEYGERESGDHNYLSALLHFQKAKSLLIEKSKLIFNNASTAANDKTSKILGEVMLKLNKSIDRDLALLNNNPILTLNLKKGYTKTDVKKSYRKVVLAYHPDKNQDCDTTSIFTTIQAAYEKLKDTSYTTAISGAGKSNFNADSFYSTPAAKQDTTTTNTTNTTNKTSTNSNDYKYSYDSSKSKYEKTHDPSKVANESKNKPNNKFFQPREKCNNTSKTTYETLEVDAITTEMLRKLLKQFGFGERVSSMNRDELVKKYNAVISHVEGIGKYSKQNINPFRPPINPYDNNPYDNKDSDLKSPRSKRNTSSSDSKTKINSNPLNSKIDNIKNSKYNRRKTEDDVSNFKFTNEDNKGKDGLSSNEREWAAEWSKRMKNDRLNSNLRKNNKEISKEKAQNDLFRTNNNDDINNDTRTFSVDEQRIQRMKRMSKDLPLMSITELTRIASISGISTDGCLEKVDLVNKLFLHYGIPEISSFDIGNSDHSNQNNNKSTFDNSNLNKFNDFLNKKYSKETTDDEDIFSHPPIPSNILSGLDLGDNNNDNITTNNDNITTTNNNTSNTSKLYSNKSSITPAQAAMKSKLNNTKAANHNSDNTVDIDSLKNIVNMSKGDFSNINRSNNKNKNLNDLSSMNKKVYNSDDIIHNNPKISTEKLKELEQKLLGSWSREKNIKVPPQNKISPSISNDNNDIFIRKYGANKFFSLYDDDEDDDEDDEDNGIDFMEEVRRRLNSGNGYKENLFVNDNNITNNHADNDNDEDNDGDNISKENVIDEEPEYMKYARSVINKNRIDSSNKNKYNNDNNKNSSIGLFLNSFLAENKNEDDSQVEFDRNNFYYKNEETEKSLDINAPPLFVNTLNNKISSEIIEDNYKKVHQGLKVKVGVTLLSESDDDDKDDDEVDSDVDDIYSIQKKYNYDNIDSINEYMLKNNVNNINNPVKSSQIEISNRLDKVDKIVKTDNTTTPRDRSNIENYNSKSNEKPVSKTRTPRDRSNINPITNNSFSVPAIQLHRSRRVRDVNIDANDIQPIVDNSNISSVNSKIISSPPDKESWFWGGDKE